MRAYVYICAICKGAYVCTVALLVHICTSMYIVFIRMHMYVCVCAYTHMYVHINKYLDNCICIYTCAHAFTCNKLTACIFVYYMPMCTYMYVLCECLPIALVYCFCLMKNQTNWPAKREAHFWRINCAFRLSKMFQMPKTFFCQGVKKKK